MLFGPTTHWEGQLQPMLAAGIPAESSARDGAALVTPGVGRDVSVLRVLVHT